MNGLRVGLVGPLPPPSGGMANQTLQLAALLQAAGLEVETIQVNAPYVPAWSARLKGLRAVFRLLPYLLRLWRAAGRVDLFHVMANSGWSWHLYAAPAICIARLRGTAVVVNYRGGEAEPFLRGSAGAVALTLHRAQALIVPSGYLAAVFGARGYQALVVPNIIDLARFRSAPVPSQTAVNRLHLLVARNLEAIYDNAGALRAFALVLEARPEARLTIAGSGPLRAELEALAAELGVAHAVRFSGRVEHAQMAALYRQAGILLNPSLVDNMPNCLLEALASGVPIVSTNVGGVSFMVEAERTALLVPPADPRALADAVLRLAAEPALADRLIQNGLDQVQQYCWPSVKPVLSQVYRDALAAPVGTLAAKS